VLKANIAVEMEAGYKYCMLDLGEEKGLVELEEVLDNYTSPFSAALRVDIEEEGYNEYCPHFVVEAPETVERGLYFELSYWMNRP
jgi:hypothetical protein